MKEYNYDLKSISPNFLEELKKRLARYNKADRFPVRSYAEKLYGKNTKKGSKPESLERDLYKKFKCSPIHGVLNRKSRGVSTSFKRKAEWETRLIIYSLLEFYEYFDLTAIKDIDNLYYSGKVGNLKDQGHVGLHIFPCELTFKIEFINQNKLERINKTVSFWEFVKGLFETKNNLLSDIARELVKKYSKTRFFDLSMMDYLGNNLKNEIDVSRFIEKHFNLSEKSIQNVVVQDVKHFDVSEEENKDFINSYLKIHSFKNEVSFNFEQLIERLNNILDMAGGSSKWVEMYKVATINEINKAKDEHLNRINELSNSLIDGES